MSASPEAVAPPRAEPKSEFEIELLFDGDCPLCAREVAFLRRRRHADRVRWTDIAARDFDPARHGLTHDDVMGQIHGVLPDGRVLTGMEVFRRVYAAVGIGWVLAPSSWPGIGRVFDAGYAWFARNRLRWTGREEVCPLDRA